MQSALENVIEFVNNAYDFQLFMRAKLHRRPVIGRINRRFRSRMPPRRTTSFVGWIIVIGFVFVRFAFESGKYNFQRLFAVCQLVGSFNKDNDITKNRLNQLGTAENNSYSINSFQQIMVLFNATVRREKSYSPFLCHRQMDVKNDSLTTATTPLLIGVLSSRQKANMTIPLISMYILFEFVKIR